MCLWAGNVEAVGGSDALLKRLLENVKPLSLPPAAPAVPSAPESVKSRLASITPVEQLQMGATYNIAHNSFDPYPWNAQMGISPEAWSRLPKKERQDIYGVHYIV